MPPLFPRCFRHQGYKVQGEIQEATVVSVTDSGTVVDAPVENILMRKSLKVSYPPALWFAAAVVIVASFDCACEAGFVEPHVMNPS